jgi:hypothetical protein
MRSWAGTRLADYAAQDPTEQRDRLVAMWRAAYPEATAETPSYMRPLILFDKRRPEERDSDAADEYWGNDTYSVTLRRRPDKVFGTDLMIQLGINRYDGTACHDWRDFRRSRTSSPAPECEAFELYPAESRLLDTSNYDTLWC